MAVREVAVLQHRSSPALGRRLVVGAITHTAPGARVVVADAEGTAYVIDPRGGRILALPSAR